MSSASFLNIRRRRKFISYFFSTHSKRFKILYFLIWLDWVLSGKAPVVIFKDLLSGFHNTNTQNYSINIGFTVDLSQPEGMDKATAKAKKAKGNRRKANFILKWICCDVFVGIKRLSIDCYFIEKRTKGEGKRNSESNLFQVSLLVVAKLKSTSSLLRHYKYPWDDVDFTQNWFKAGERALLIN